MDERGVTFRLGDPERTLTAVRVRQELRRPRDAPELRWDDGVWTGRLNRPAVDRMEYSLELRHPDGGTETICDPANPRRAPGPFGDKSVIEFPGYRPPAWIEGGEPTGGELLRQEVELSGVSGTATVLLWTSRNAQPEARLPLLVAHDGLELGEYARLLRFLDRLTSAGRLPPMRAALVGPPGDRDEHYSASAAYAKAVVTDLLPLLDWLAPSPEGVGRVGMGASLGALAMLHAHRTYAESFAGLYLQSGSYFRQRFDQQESGFARFRRISRFVGGVLSARPQRRSPVVTMTCGAVEENLANNRAVAAALASQGYDVALHENADAHNWVGWRDTWDPHLVDLLLRVWS